MGDQRFHPSQYLSNGFCLALDLCNRHCLFELVNEGGNCYQRVAKVVPQLKRKVLDGVHLVHLDEFGHSMVGGFEQSACLSKRTTNGGKRRLEARRER